MRSVFGRRIAERVPSRSKGCFVAIPSGGGGCDFLEQIQPQPCVYKKLFYRDLVILLASTIRELGFGNFLPKVTSD